MSSLLQSPRFWRHLTFGLVLTGIGTIPLAVRAQTGAAPAPAGVSTTAWTTFKGDNQRTNSSDADITMPLTLRWRYSSDGPGRNYVTSPLVLGVPGRQRVYFAAGNTVYCLDAQTGTTADGWKPAQLVSTVVMPLTQLSTDNGDLILVPQQNGRLTALRATDGGVVWDNDTKGLLAATAPVIINTKDGIRILLATENAVIAYDTSGVADPTWKIPLGRAGVNPASPIAFSKDGARFFMLNSEGKLMGFDTRERKVIWTVTQAVRTGTAPVVAGDYVLTANGLRVTAYETSGGAPKWIFDPKGEVLGSPAIKTFDGVTLAYFGTSRGDFYAVDVKDGTVKWKTHSEDYFTGAPLALKNAILVGTHGGSLVGFEPSNGKVIWNYRLRTERDPNIGTTNNNRGTTGRGGRGGQIQPIQDNGDEFGGGGEFDGGTTDGGPGGFGTGRGGTGRGGTGRGGTTTATLRTYGVTAAPSAVDDTVYVLGDNAALYSFTSDNLDSDAPRVVEPSVALPNDQNAITAQLIPATAPPLIPGKGPIYFAAQLDDTGTGVDTNSIQVSLDGAPVDAKNVTFDVGSGVLTVVLLEKGDGKNFEDGMKQINVVFKDYAGNQTAYSGSIMIDNNTPAPSSTQGRGGRGGRGGFGGGQGGFGGGRGGFGGGQGGFGGGGFGGGGRGGFGGGDNGGDNGGDGGGGGNPFGNFGDGGDNGGDNGDNGDGGAAPNNG